MSHLAPPFAPKRPHRIAQLGRTLVDNSGWLKDDSGQQVLRDPKVLRTDVREHLDAENRYAKALLESTEALQAQMFAEMKGRIKEDDSSVPTPDGPWDYYVRYDLGAQHPIHARRPRGSYDGEQVLLDEDALVAALQSGHLAAAGLDVFRAEPAYDLRLRDMPNVFATPHMGSATVETRTAMGQRALDNIAAVLAGQRPQDLVNA